MEKEGHRCTSIRGDMEMQLRDKVVNEFRAGITKILISTDVLSRGFDVTQERTLCMSSLVDSVPARSEQPPVRSPACKRAVGKAQQPFLHYDDTCGVGGGASAAGPGAAVCVCR